MVCRHKVLMIFLDFRKTLCDEWSMVENNPLRGIVHSYTKDENKVFSLWQQKFSHLLVSPIGGFSPSPYKNGSSTHSDGLEYNCSLVVWGHFFIILFWRNQDVVYASSIRFEHAFLFLWYSLSSINFEDSFLEKLGCSFCVFSPFWGHFFINTRAQVSIFRLFWACFFIVQGCSFKIPYQL